MVKILFEPYRKWRVDEDLRFWGRMCFISDCIPLDIMNPILAEYAAVYNYC